MLNGVKHLLANMHSLQIDPSLSLRMTRGEGSLIHNSILKTRQLQHSAINRNNLPGNIGGHV